MFTTCTWLITIPILLYIFANVICCMFNFANLASFTLVLSLCIRSSNRTRILYLCYINFVANPVPICSWSGFFLDIPNSFWAHKICVPFLTWFKHLVVLKIKDKICFGPNCILDNILYIEKSRITRVYLWTKDPDLDPDPYRLRPDAQHFFIFLSARGYFIHFIYRLYFIQSFHNISKLYTGSWIKCMILHKMYLKG